MSRFLLVLVGPLVVLLVVACFPTRALPVPGARLPFRSPLGLAVDQTGQKAYVALHTADAVAVVDLHSGKVLHEIAVGRGPYDLVLAKDTLYVTCEDADALVVVDLKEYVVRRRIPIGQAPRGLALDPTGTRVYVACHDASAICLVALETEPVQFFPVPRSPDRIVLSQAGYLFTLGEPVGEGGLISLLTREDHRLFQRGGLTGASNLRGLALGGTSPVVVHQRPKSQVPTTQVWQGWVFTNALTLTTAGGGGGGVPRRWEDWRRFDGILSFPSHHPG